MFEAQIQSVFDFTSSRQYYLLPAFVYKFKEVLLA